MNIFSQVLRPLLFGSALAASTTAGVAAEVSCGQDYTVVKGDTLSRISLKAYGSLVYQPIYNANVEVIGTNPDMIYIGQVFSIPCLQADNQSPAELDDDEVTQSLVFTFSRPSAPPFIINSGIIDPYLAEIAEVTEGRVTFVDPEEVVRDHAQQFNLVTSGQVDGAYVLNVHLAETHPLLQLSMLPMFGGSAEQTAVSMWRLHEEYLSRADYFPEAELLGFVSAPAAHIWRDEAMPVTPTENISAKNNYHVPYFHGLDTRGPAVMRAEFATMLPDLSANGESPAFFMAHGAALAVGFWTADSNVFATEVDNGLYTPTFSVVLSNEAWAQISEADQQAIRAISGEAFAHRSAAWDAFDNGFRAKMLKEGLKFKKADRALLQDLWVSSLPALRTWSEQAEDNGIPANEAINYYLGSLRSLEDTLIYRADETFVDQHPFVTSGN